MKLLKFYENVSLCEKLSGTFVVYWNDYFGYLCEMEFKECNYKRAHTFFKHKVAILQKKLQLDLFTE